MRTAELIHALNEVRSLYGDIPVRVDLGLETRHKAYDVDTVMCASFPNSDTKNALVIFTGWKSWDTPPDHRVQTLCSQFARELTGWYNLVGDLPIRTDLGFFQNGLCYDVENVNIGHFPNEDNLTALVIYPKSALPRVNVHAN